MVSGRSRVCATLPRPAAVRHAGTGPGWKKSAGVITPSRLKTMPFFMTNDTLRSASMSASGSPGTAIRSAKSPA